MDGVRHPDRVVGRYSAMRGIAPRHPHRRGQLPKLVRPAAPAAPPAAVRPPRPPGTSPGWVELGSNPAPTSRPAHHERGPGGCGAGRGGRPAHHRVCRDGRRRFHHQRRHNGPRPAELRHRGKRLYAWGKLGFVVSGGASGFASSNPSDALIDLQHGLKRQYRGNAVDDERRHAGHHPQVQGRPGPVPVGPVQPAAGRGRPAAGATRWSRTISCRTWPATPSPSPSGTSSAPTTSWTAAAWSSLRDRSPRCPTSSSSVAVAWAVVSTSRRSSCSSAAPDRPDPLRLAQLLSQPCGSYRTGTTLFSGRSSWT